MTALLISQIVLWIVVVALSLACLALTRQLGVLHERIAPMGALALNRRLAGGSPAPALSLQTLTGSTLTVGGLGAATESRQCQLIFFLSPSCPVCKTLLPVLKSIRERERAWLAILLASDGGEIASHREFVQRHGLEEFPYVLSQTLGMTYGISRVPYAVLIDEQGMVSALGLVNSREQLESLFEARRLGKPTLQEYLHEREVHPEEIATKLAPSGDESASAESMSLIA
jgi:methylamine dehydrogenase accessory protein MauD